jgi:hypothetical protein
MAQTWMTRMAQTWMIGTLLALRTSVTETHSRGDA